MNILDAIIRETAAHRGSNLAVDLRGLRAPWNEDVGAERRRLASLAARSGPKGALAGHVEELLRLS